MQERRKFTFRSRPEAVAAARRALDGVEELFDHAIFYDTSLCVSELVTNAILHAQIGADEELVLEIAVSPELVRVAVTDPGEGFEPPEPDPGDESGWGLFIVDRLSDSWGVERGDGTCVWFEMSPVREARGEPENAASGAGARRVQPSWRAAVARLLPQAS